MLKEKVKALSEKYFPRVVELRRQIHAHPELSWNEYGTAQFIANELQKLGLQVQTGVAKNGVVALLQGGKPSSKCIALRADMDALPIQEANEINYKSINEGVMHACGHDAHSANLLGVAMILAELKDEIEGCIKFIFQPSEEKIPSGAEAMINEGVLQHPDVDKIFGIHVSPELEVGTIGFCPGKFMASSDEIYITVRGRGGHAAQKDKLINPLLLASHLLLQMEMLNAGNPDFVLSFGKIEGKGATNVVPDVVEIAGTLRCFNEDFRTAMHQKIEEVCADVGAQFNGKCELNLLKGYPVLENNEALTRSAMQAAANYTGVKVIELPKRMGSEDFAYYSHRVPACFYRLGTGNKSKGITSGLHTPTFNIDEDALKESIGLMSWLALNA